MRLVKIPPPPLVPFVPPLLNQPLELVRLEEVLQCSMGVGVQMAELLLLELHRGLMFSDPPLQVRRALLVAAVRFLGSQQVRMRLIPVYAFQQQSSEAIPPLPVTTGTSIPAYSVFNDKDPTDSAIIVQYKSITATPAYRGTSLEVG